MSKGHDLNDRFVSDYCDGTVYKSHPLCSSDSLTLEIFAYYDDVEVCNPLGSRAKKHMLGVYIVTCTYNTCTTIHYMYSLSYDLLSFSPFSIVLLHAGQYSS